MNQRKIKKVEVSKLFWRDLDDWRKHPEYHKIRSNIGKMVEKVMNGEPGGDVPFMGNPVWEDIRHIHVGQKLVMFTRYTDDETLRICALKNMIFMVLGVKEKTRRRTQRRSFSGLQWQRPRLSLNGERYHGRTHRRYLTILN